MRRDDRKGDDRYGDFPTLQDLPEEDFIRELLGNLDQDRPEVPSQLPDRTIRKVQAEMTSRDLLDLTTFVFLMRFCAPLLDLMAAFFGHDPVVQTGPRPETQSGLPASPPTRATDLTNEIADDLSDNRSDPDE